MELQPTTAATTSAAPRHLTTVATMSAWPFSSCIEVVQTGNGSLEAAPVAAYASCNARKHATCSQLPQLDPSAASIVLTFRMCCASGGLYRLYSKLRSKRTRRIRCSGAC